MVEKRSIKRHLKRLKVRYGLEQPIKLAFIEDVTEAGMFIRTHDVLKPGRVIIVEVYLSENTKILFKGRIMWEKKLPPAMVGQVKKAGMGIKIIEISDGEKTLWKEFIKNCNESTKVNVHNIDKSHEIHNANLNSQSNL
jgi:Tfp pilus assembly protein PilZ